MNYNKIKQSLLSLLVIAALATGCSKSDEATGGNGPAAPHPPTVTVTDPAGAITSTSATSGGTITSNGGAALTASGVCWSAGSIQPTIADNSVNVGTNVGSFVANMTGLTPNTLYYVKAYATNSSGTSYGPRISFTTLP